MAEWTVAFALTALAAVGAMSIGMFILPVALGAVVLAARRNRSWPEALAGGFLGVAAVCLLVAYLQRGYVPCPPLPATVHVGPGQGGGCGGLDPTPWLGVGLLLAATGLLSYALVRRAGRAAAA